MIDSNAIDPKLPKPAMLTNVELFEATLTTPTCPRRISPMHAS
ncbi:hypothetical protein [Streptomyces sp. Go40/10]|nr:hypothetical protein [Streptomyces sp. Go40/10]